MTNPKFIAFEGLDGCGKSTQALLLAQRFPSIPRLAILCPWLTQEPSWVNFKRSPTLPPLSELLLFEADRADHVFGYGGIQEHLNEDRWVICDRYIGSTIAYQGYGKGLDLGLINSLNEVATGGLVPDLTIWLDLSPEACAARRKARGNDDVADTPEDRAFFERVHAGYLAQSAQPGWFRINASGSAEDVSDRIWAVVQEYCFEEPNDAT